MQLNRWQVAFVAKCLLAHLRFSLEPIRQIKGCPRSQSHAEFRVSKGSCRHVVFFFQMFRPPFGKLPRNGENAPDGTCGTLLASNPPAPLVANS